MCHYFGCTSKVTECCTIKRLRSALLSQDTVSKADAALLLTIITCCWCCCCCWCWNCRALLVGAPVRRRSVSRSFRISCWPGGLWGAWKWSTATWSGVLCGTSSAMCYVCVISRSSCMLTSRVGCWLGGLWGGWKWSTATWSVVSTAVTGCSECKHYSHM